MASEAQINANRENAQKSTGPKTIEGKNISRLNATVHGFAAKVCILPHENKEEVEKTRLDFEKELNPTGSAVKSAIIDGIVHHVISRNRLFITQHGLQARAIRDTITNRKEKAQLNLEESIDLLLHNPGKAVREMSRSVAGLDWLLERWKGLYSLCCDINMGYPDLRLLHTISADNVVEDRWKPHECFTLEETKQLEMLSPFFNAVTLQLRYAEVYHRVMETKNPDDHDAMKKHYNHNRELREAEWEELPLYVEAAKYRSTHLKEYILNQIDIIKLKREVLVKELSQQEIPDFFDHCREAFDDSKQGELMHRYLREHETAMYRGFNELRQLSKPDVLCLADTNVLTELDIIDGLNDDTQAVVNVKPGVVFTRNEPNFGPTPEQKAVNDELLRQCVGVKNQPRPAGERRTDQK